MNGFDLKLGTVAQNEGHFNIFYHLIRGILTYNWVQMNRFDLKLGAFQLLNRQNELNKKKKKKRRNFLLNLLKIIFH